ncbi:MAG: hypothetical protein V1824_01470, partial [archaeon]
MSKSIIKNDRFRKNRGGHSRLLELFCRKCDALVLTYQKDGQGGLKRLYFDRIFYPEKLNSLKDIDNSKISQISPLICDKCKAVLGVP